MCRRYFYSLVRKYLSLFILPHNSVIEFEPANLMLVGEMPQGKVTFRKRAREVGSIMGDFPEDLIVPIEKVQLKKPDYFVVSGLLHYERDIQGFLALLHKLCNRRTRVIFTYYSSLWRPLANLASAMGLRRKAPESI